MEITSHLIFARKILSNPELMISCTDFSVKTFFMASKVSNIVFNYENRGVTERSERMCFFIINCNKLLCIAIKIKFLSKLIDNYCFANRVVERRVCILSGVSAFQTSLSIFITIGDTVSSIASCLLYDNMTEKIKILTKPLGVALIAMNVFIGYQHYCMNKYAIFQLKNRIEKSPHNLLGIASGFFENKETYFGLEEETVSQERGLAAYIKIGLDESVHESFVIKLEECFMNPQINQTDTLQKLFALVVKSIESENSLIRNGLFIFGAKTTFSLISRIYPGSLVHSIVMWTMSCFSIISQIKHRVLFSQFD